MDARAWPSNCKMQKLFAEQNSGENGDRISCLPEGVLLHILSFLPTKFAVGTSILSTKWRYLWISLPILDFCDDLLCSTKSTSEDQNDTQVNFMNFVDRVLLFHKASLQKFCLTCKTAHDPSRVNAWISTVIMRKVREMIIDVVLKDSFAFPKCPLQCEVLTVLKVEMDDVLKIPASITFSNLKILHCRYIGFSCDQSNQEVTLLFPTLEEFIMDECAWLEIKSVDIYAPMLKRLDIDDFSNYITSFYDYEMNIYAETLTSLRLNSGLSCMYTLHNMPLIVDASINLSECNTENIGNSVDELIKRICTVKDLKICCDVIKVLSSNMPIFSNVVNLDLVITGSLGSDRVLNLLQKMPKIESLVFSGGLGNFYDAEQLLTHTTLQQCFLACLKSENTNGR
ncbi:F-box protein [Thalictrum thalictroides]|uniref:F-box protein n=1 Tax=Thalictrum thalictroides TaxID=46969 RepID=A0A7J6V929_THATH|nr:F-box protein [Thalictrum thalictroides]